MHKIVCCFLLLGMFAVGLMAATPVAHADGDAGSNYGQMLNQAQGGSTDTSAMGSQIKSTLEGLMRGNMGALVGCLVSLFGFWMAFMQQNFGWGLAVILLGVMITAGPSIYNSIEGGFTQAFGDVIGNNTVSQ